MRVHVVDPPAYTPPYDHALCSALAHAGVETALYTSHFAYGEVASPDGYERHEFFYRHARGGAASLLRRATKLAVHVPDMARYRRVASRAQLVHYQWLTVPQVDRHMLARGRPLVITSHDVLPREPHPGQLRAQRRLYERFDAVIVHSEHGRRRLIEEAGLRPDRVHMIEHGVFDHLAAAPRAALPLNTPEPVVLFFGLLRPYKGLDVLLEAWRGVKGAQLWIAGMPRMDIAALRARAGGNVHFFPRFISEGELGAFFARADLVVLPYREIDQSGVLFTALAFGKPLLLSDVGGFPEVAARGAARTVAAGDAQALHDVLIELLGDPGAREALAAGARSAAAGPYAWDAIARRTIALYGELGVT